MPDLHVLVRQAVLQPDAVNGCLRKGSRVHTQPNAPHPRPHVLRSPCPQRSTSVKICSLISSKCTDNEYRAASLPVVVVVGVAVGVALDGGGADTVARSRARAASMRSFFACFLVFFTSTTVGVAAGAVAVVARVVEHYYSDTHESTQYMHGDVLAVD
jgi:hypothetical protein